MNIKSLLTLKRIIVMICMAIFAVVYFFTDPARTVWMPKCPLKMMTGIDCPGCGSQRMIHALLNFDLSGAWHANPFLVLSTPYLLILVFVSILPLKFPKLTRIALSPVTTGIFLGFAGIWTIIRNSFC